MIMSMRVALHETLTVKTLSPDSPNPYLNARRSWNIHMGHVQFGERWVFHWCSGSGLSVWPLWGITSWHQEPVENCPDGL